MMRLDFTMPGTPVHHAPEDEKDKEPKWMRNGVSKFV